MYSQQPPWMHTYGMSSLIIEMRKDLLQPIIDVTYSDKSKNSHMFRKYINNNSKKRWEALNHLWRSVGNIERPLILAYKAYCNKPSISSFNKS
jgi:hypothetical protein